MRIIKRSRLEAFVASIVWTIGWIAVIASRIEKTPGGGEYLDKSSSSIRDFFGPGDAGSLLDVAITWSSFKNLDPINQFWIVKLWAPGLPIIETPMIWIEKIGIPFYITFISTIVVLWFCAFYLFWRYYSPLIGRKISGVIAITSYISWDFHYFYVSGLFSSEPIGYCLVLISLLGIFYELTFATKTSKINRSIFGMLLGLAIWQRHTLDTYLILVIGMVIGLVIFDKSFHILSNRISIIARFYNKPKTTSHTPTLKHFLLFLFVAFLVTAPWRVISPVVFQGSPGLMSSGGGIIAMSVWETPESPMGKYWGVYGSNWACKLNLKKCEEISLGIKNKDYEGKDLILLASKAAFQNPLEYVGERTKYALKFSSPVFFQDSKQGNLIAYAGILMLIFYLYRLTKNNSKKLALLIWFPLMLATIFQLMWIHYEPRYFIPLRMGFLGLIISLVSLRRSRAINQMSPNKLSW